MPSQMTIGCKLATKRRQHMGLVLNEALTLAHAADERDMGTGWVFTPPDQKTLLQAMDNALTTYNDFPDSWKVGCPVVPHGCAAAGACVGIDWPVWPAASGAYSQPPGPNNGSCMRGGWHDSTLTTCTRSCMGR